MVKPRKCAYKYCKSKSIDDINEAVHVGNYYYHFGCYEKKYMKNEIYSVFCDYVTNEESGLLIKKKIKDYIDIDGYSPSYVYFALYYAIKNKIKFKSIFGLKYLLDRDKVKQEYANVLDKYKNVKIQPENLDFVYSKEFKGGWRELIG